ncbi:ferredoxin [Virgisporangium aliadipatigenens]|uniref:Ferredoxin n=2 Tax=Virgisporangium aliadipatigenens TaxID=741659 RepID=A0A8J3YNW2_9ACTN|nr:ferredoxin [Virgisporangium aliadipatigenens]
MVIDPIHTIAAAVGFASMFFLWLAIILGLSLARGWTMTSMKHSSLLALHGSMALIGLTLGIVHGFAQLAPADKTVHLIDVVVPFTNAVDPFGIGVGVIALEIMTALAISMTMQKLMGFHRWRALHSLAYAAYTLATGHILISGSETGGPVITVIVLIPWLIMVGLWMTGTASKEDKEGMADKFTTRLRGKLTTVQVDPIVCARFGFCEQEAPEVFQLRGDGQLAYQTVVADNQVDAAVAAVRACPARAISIEMGTSASVGMSGLRAAMQEQAAAPAPQTNGNYPTNEFSRIRTNGRR